MERFKKILDYCVVALAKKINVPVWVFVAMTVVYMLPRPF